MSKHSSRPSEGITLCRSHELITLTVVNSPKSQLCTNRCELTQLTNSPLWIHKTRRRDCPQACMHACVWSERERVSCFKIRQYIAACAHAFTFIRASARARCSFFGDVGISPSSDNCHTETFVCHRRKSFCPSSTPAQSLAWFPSFERHKLQVHVDWELFSSLWSQRSLCLLRAVRDTNLPVCVPGNLESIMHFEREWRVWHKQELYVSSKMRTRTGNVWRRSWKYRSKDSP